MILTAMTVIAEKTLLVQITEAVIEGSDCVVINGVKN